MVVTAATGGNHLFGAHIARWAAEQPQREALVFGDAAWTYGRFDDAIATVAAGLHAAGVRPADTILLAAPTRPEVLFHLFALSRLGAIAVPVHPALTASEISSVAAAVSPAAVVGDADFLARAPGVPRRLSWDDDVPNATTVRPAAGGAVFREWRGVATQAAVIAFTSGTSGRPKGIVLTHENLHRSLRSALERLELTYADTVLVTTPLSHAAVLSGLAQHVWSVGGRVVLAPRFEPDSFVSAVHRHGVTTAFVVGAMLSRIVRSAAWPSLQGSSLRWLLVGGTPPVGSLTVALARAGIAAINSYGLTEAGGGVTYASASEVADHPLSAGPPVRDIELKIKPLDDGSPVHRGIGVICLRGPMVAHDYITTDGERVPVAGDDGWFHTGDRGYRDDAGRLYVIGRIKDTIITGGENVDPAEVEEALNTVPGIRDAAVVGTPDARWGEVVTAVLVTHPGVVVRLDELREQLKGRLAGYKMPRVLIVVDGIPRTSTGKIRRGLLLSIVAGTGTAVNDNV
jgi:fatty-acyl-CoA synthase